MAAVTWALVLPDWVRSTAEPARAFDTASFQQHIWQIPDTRPRGRRNVRQRYPPVLPARPRSARSGFGGSVGDASSANGHPVVRPANPSARRGVPATRDSEGLPRGVYNGNSSTLSPDAWLQVCPRRGLQRLSLCLGHEHSAARHKPFKRFMLPTEYSKGGCCLDTTLWAEAGMAASCLSSVQSIGGSRNGKPTRGPSTFSSSFAPAEGGRLVAVTSGVRRHELRRWCRRPP